MKLLVSDYDLTLNSFDYDVRFNMYFIEKFQRDGNLFFLNTGRNYESIRREISKYRINFDYLGCCDGNLVLNKKYEPVYCTSLSKVFLERLKVLTEKYDNVLVEPILFQGNILEYVVTVVKKNEKFVNELMVFCKNNDLVMKRFPKVVLDKLRIRMIDCFYLGKEEVSKSSAVSLVSELENILKCDIFTIGDHLNDLEMIEDYNGYTLPWGKKSVKEVSQGQVLSVASLVKKIMR